MYRRFLDPAPPSLLDEDEAEAPIESNGSELGGPKNSTEDVVDTEDEAPLLSLLADAC